MTATRFARWMRRHVAVLLLAGIGIFVGAGVAAAFWNIGVNSSPRGSAKGAQLTTPASPNASVNTNGSVAVTWAHPVGQLTGATYSVTRTGGTEGSTVVCANTAGTMCTDNGPLTPAVLYTYSIVAHLGTNWVSTAATTTATAETPSFTIVLSSGPYTAGTPITVSSVTAQVAGVTDVTYGASTGTSKTVTWSGLANSPSGQAPSYPSSSLSFTSGLASPGTMFTAFDAGIDTLTATEAAVPTVTGSVSFTVNSATATTLAISSGSGQSATVNTTFTNPLMAKVADTFGNPVSGAVVTFTAPGSGASDTFLATSSGGTCLSSSGSAVASCTATTNASGLASSLTSKANTTAGTYNVAATSSGTTPNPLNFSETNTAGTATTIAVSSGSGQSATVNTAFTDPLMVKVTDTFGNPVSGATVTFTAPSSGASGTVLAATNGGACLSASGSAVASCTATTNASGLASSLTFKANTSAGTYNVAATSAGTTPNPLNFSETNLAGAAATVTATSGQGQSAAISAAFTHPLVATVTDSFGNSVSGVTVTFAGPTSGASETFAAAGCVANSPTSSCTEATNSSGQATSSTFTANATAGTYNVTASATGATSATFSETNFGALAKFAVTAPSTATAGTAFTANLTAQDSSGNTVTNYTGTQCITFSGPANSPSAASPSYPAKGSCTSGSAVTFLNGVASSSNSPSITLVDAQTTALTATDNPTSKTGTSGTIVVSAGAASNLAWTSPTVTGGTLSSPCLFTCTDPGLGNNKAFTASVSVTDGDGNVVSGLGAGHTVALSTTQNQSGGSFNTVTLTISSTGAATSTATFTYTAGSGSSWTDIIQAATALGTTYTDATATVSK